MAMSCIFKSDKHVIQLILTVFLKYNTVNDMLIYDDENCQKIAIKLIFV